MDSNAPTTNIDSATAAGDFSSEPGGQDNRVSWIPSDYPATEDWQDGQEYTLKNVRIRQTASGEAEILSMEVDGDEAEGKPPVSDDQPATPSRQSVDEPVDTISNPAIRRLVKA